MSWITTGVKAIFGKSTLNIGDTFSTVSRGIDNLKLTEQERADKLGKFVENTLNENTMRSKSRRFIAKFVIINVFLVFWLCVAMIFKGIDIKPILELANIFMIPTAFLMVLAFFFGGYYLGMFKNKEKK